MSPVPERSKQTVRHTGGGPRVDSVAGPNEFYRFRSTRALCFIVLFPIHVSPHIIHTSCAVSRVDSSKAHTKEPPCGSFNTYILSIRVFVRKVKISFHLLFSCKALRLRCRTERTICSRLHTRKTECPRTERLPAPVRSRVPNRKKRQIDPEKYPQRAWSLVKPQSEELFRKNHAAVRIGMY